MNCSDCAFFTDMAGLPCAVNPTHCHISAEPCKDFEFTNINPCRIACGDFVYNLTDNVLEERVNGETIMAWTDCNSDCEYLLSREDRDENLAILLFLNFVDFVPLT